MTETKNNLSALVDRVRQGETILILDRGRPVARLESVLLGAGEPQGRLERLERAGVLRRARVAAAGELPAGSLAEPTAGASALAALLAERRDGR